MITKEENALLTLIRSMNAPTKALMPERRKTQKDYDLQAIKDFNFYLNKKNLC